MHFLIAGQQSAFIVLCWRVETRVLCSWYLCLQSLTVVWSRCLTGLSPLKAPPGANPLPGPLLAADRAPSLGADGQDLPLHCLLARGRPQFMAMCSSSNRSLLHPLSKQSWRQRPLSLRTRSQNADPTTSAIFFISKFLGPATHWGGSCTRAWVPGAGATSLAYIVVTD